MDRNAGGEAAARSDDLTQLQVVAVDAEDGYRVAAGVDREQLALAGVVRLSDGNLSPIPGSWRA